MRFSNLFAIISIALVLLPGAAAHELQDNRATLVLRDRTHLSVTLFLAYPEALHLTLAPQRPIQEFLVVYSAMKPEELQRELLRAQARFESTTRIQLDPGGDVVLKNWVWPDANQVRTMLQQRVMQAVVDPNGHAHEAPVEIHADFNAEQEITSMRVQFPEEFRRMLVVAFRPSQAWVEPKAISAAIRF